MKRKFPPLLVLLLGLLWLTCNKDDDTPVPDDPKITCSAGCSSMSWQIVDETGPSSRVDNCTRDWQGNQYIETCNGTITYSVSGRSYTYEVIYDWINCDISVTVDGLGTCTDP